MIIYRGENKKIILKEDEINYYNSNILYTKLYTKEPLKYSLYSICTSLILVNNSKNVLILGTGLGTAVAQCEEMAQNIKITTVDIDKEIVNITKKLFEKKYSNINFVISDAITYIEKCDTIYDYIMIDLSDKNRLPKIFAEEKFLKKIFERLSDNGIVTFNSSMRDLSWLYEELQSPLNYIYKSFYRAGFRKIYKIDFSYSGWVFATKTENDILMDLENVKHHNNYINGAIKTLKNFTYNIKEEQVVDYRSNSDDLMDDYKNYLLQCILRIRRYKETDSYRKDVEKKLSLLFVKYSKNKILKDGVKGAINSIFVCDEIEYFKELEEIWEHITSVKNFLIRIMLPSEEILKELPKIVRKELYFFSNYQFDTIINAKV